MGFLGQSTVGKLYQVTVLMEGFQIQATLNVHGTFQMFVNDEQRTVLNLNEATVYGLERGNPAGSMVIPELYVRKNHIHALLFDRALPREETGLMARTEALAFYSPFYAFQGNFHMAPDWLLPDFIDIAKGAFLGVSNVSIFPLFQPQAAVIQHAEMGFIYRDTVRMHHKI